MGAGLRCVKVIKDVGVSILPFINVDDIILALGHIMWKSLEAECQIVMRLLDAFVNSRLATLKHCLKLLDLACHQDLPSMEGTVFQAEIGIMYFSDVTGGVILCMVWLHARVEYCGSYDVTGGFNWI